jgi:predicted DNA-binding transcriptional regulator AlpA
MQTQPKTQRWFSKRQVAERYGVCMRTVERWAESGRFPRGIRLSNKRFYWLDDVLMNYERSLVGGGARAAIEQAAAAEAAAP